MTKYTTPNILLICPVSDLTSLERSIELWIESGVELVSAWGMGCEKVHDRIDEIVIGDGTDTSRFLMTSWHANETLDEAKEFASQFGRREVEEVRL